jgi:hypothetical protein
MQIWLLYPSLILIALLVLGLISTAQNTAGSRLHPRSILCVHKCSSFHTGPTCAKEHSPASTWLVFPVHFRRLLTKEDSTSRARIPSLQMVARIHGSGRLNAKTGLFSIRLLRPQTAPTVVTALSFTLLKRLTQQHLRQPESTLPFGLMPYLPPTTLNNSCSEIIIMNLY